MSANMTINLIVKERAASTQRVVVNPTTRNPPTHSPPGLKDLYQQKLEFYLLLAILVVSLFLATIAVYYVCRRQNTTVASRMSKSGIKAHSGNNSRRKNGGDSPNNDSNVCNPLVPKPTAAPCQGTADRSPPPLPPKFSRNHQLYANLNHHRLPTVEVRPIQSTSSAIVQRRSTGGASANHKTHTSCCHSPASYKASIGACNGGSGYNDNTNSAARRSKRSVPNNNSGHRAIKSSSARGHHQPSAMNENMNSNSGGEDLANVSAGAVIGDNGKRRTSNQLETSQLENDVGSHQYSN